MKSSTCSFISGKSLGMSNCTWSSYVNGDSICLETTSFSTKPRRFSINENEFLIVKVALVKTTLCILSKKSFANKDETSVGSAYIYTAFLAPYASISIHFTVEVSALFRNKIGRAHV